MPCALEQRVHEPLGHRVPPLASRQAGVRRGAGALAVQDTIAALCGRHGALLPRRQRRDAGGARGEERDADGSYTATLQGGQGRARGLPEDAMRRLSTPLLIVAIGLLAGAAPADAPSASASASSAPPAPPAPLAPLGPMADWPDTTSPKPKPEEWDAAAPVLLERPSEGCTTSRVREWLRVSCRFGMKLLTGVRVIGGPTEGVELTDKKPAPGQP